jgi:hypothetical protein
VQLSAARACAPRPWRKSSMFAFYSLYSNLASECFRQRSGSTTKDCAALLEGTPPPRSSGSCESISQSNGGMCMPRSGFSVEASSTSMTCIPGWRRWEKSLSTRDCETESSVCSERRHRGAALGAAPEATGRKCQKRLRDVAERKGTSLPTASAAVSISTSSLRRVT